MTCSKSEGLQSISIFACYRKIVIEKITEKFTYNNAFSSVPAEFLSFMCIRVGLQRLLLYRHFANSDAFCRSPIRTPEVASSPTSNIQTWRELVLPPETCHEPPNRSNYKNETNSSRSWSKNPADEVCLRHQEKLHERARLSFSVIWRNS